jgi:hypothetical protein
MKRFVVPLLVILLAPALLAQDKQQKPREEDLKTVTLIIDGMT